MLARWNQQFIALTTREKTLVMISGVVLILFAGFTFVIEPRYLQNQSTQLTIANKQIELQGIDQQISLLKAALADDPNVALQRRIDNLAQRVEALDQEFANQIKELVPAHQMPLVIEQMLTESSRLKLLELSSIEPVSVFADDSENADLPLYQHGVRFEFEGGYVDILEYLEKVEGLPWQLYWHSFDYQVNEYPTALITIELFTLSTNLAFMGVQ